MDTNAIIDSLNREIGNLQQAREILAGKPVKAKRTMSLEARKRIQEGQKKRWAKFKKAA